MEKKENLLLTILKGIGEFFAELGRFAFAFLDICLSEPGGMLLFIIAFSVLIIGGSFLYSIISFLLC